jgi:hypothetical protein
MVFIVVMGIRVEVVTLRAMEHQKVHAEGIKGRHEHTRKHRKIGKSSSRQMALGDRFNDAVFGVKA